MADDQSTSKSHEDTDAAAEQIAENIERNPAGARPVGTPPTPGTAPNVVVVEQPPANITVEGDLNVESNGNDTGGGDSDES